LGARFVAEFLELAPEVGIAHGHLWYKHPPGITRRAACFVVMSYGTGSSRARCITEPNKALMTAASRTRSTPTGTSGKWQVASKNSVNSPLATNHLPLFSRLSLATHHLSLYFKPDFL